MSSDKKKMIYDCSQFETTIDKRQEILKLMAENGFVIIKDILTNDECEEMIDGIWNSFGEITKDLDDPIDRNKPETWRNFLEMEPFHHIYNKYGIVHADFLWKIRQNHNILDLFSLLYDCYPDDLLVSFDGVSVQTPPELFFNNDVMNQKRKKSWYHVDSSFLNKNVECYQSWVTGMDVEEGDFTTAFFIGSHKSFAEFGDRFGIIDKKNFYKLKMPEEREFFEKRHDQVKITCKRGSLIVWDSRLVHTGVEPLPNRPNQNTRMICFLSYGPRTTASSNTLKRRIDIYKKRRATTHWSHMHLQMSPEGKSKKMKTLDTRPIETNLLGWLVGYNQDCVW